MRPEKIREIRKENGMTQADLATKLGVQRAVVSKYETGVIEPSVTQLENIAAALGVTPDYLLGYTTIPAPADTVQADIDHLTGSVQADSDILTRGIDPVKEAERWRKENHEMVDALNVYGTASAHDFLEFLTKDMKNTDKTKE